MNAINIHAAKTQLSRLIDEAEAGHETIIARAGRPVARLVPLNAVGTKRRLGILAGKFRVPDDFDAPLPDDVLDGFEPR
ncbi:type II toxin-antitoxin system Phd/YefM family antitoxin [Acidiphilium sp. AL]|uniref:Antitoxin n=1 Tax=Acidiphilium iwatense TaxID=768198 RepID=A0ABS9DZ06_9PROT|nr:MULTISPECIES: type II toxin-antitoxin system Phd/YefM family antitoxin [Acidiphilium]MCF3946662.1 type II toxin-antitoxin system Phd/YefM family antitoxin [Acidiphilium iwatense]MCU4159987.1 type II toxin-antitoxin system Phd/YefM family antitoxin [Acidiphilium sp. AL]